MKKRYQSNLFLGYVEGALEVEEGILAAGDDNFLLPVKENPEIMVGVRLRMPSGAGCATAKTTRGLATTAHYAQPRHGLSQTTSHAGGCCSILKTV